MALLNNNKKPRLKSNIKHKAPETTWIITINNPEKVFVIGINNDLVLVLGHILVFITEIISVKMVFTEIILGNRYIY